MATKSNARATVGNNSNATLESFAKLGEKLGGASSALWESCKEFSTLANAGTIDIGKSDESWKAACKAHADSFANGQTKASGDSVPESSRKQYADQYKLWSDKLVNAALPTIEKEARAFVDSVPYAKRNKKRFFDLAKAAASQIRKEKVKAAGITHALFESVVSGTQESGTPESAAKAEAKAKAQRAKAFELAVLELFAAGELDTESQNALLKIGAHVKVEFKFEAPKAETSDAKPDLAALIAAAVAQAMAAAKA